MRHPVFVFRFQPGSWITVALAVLVGILLFSSFDLSPVSARTPQAILGLTLFALLLELAKESLSGQLHAVPGEAADPAIPGIRLSVALAWLGALLLAVWCAGAALGGAAFCLAWLRWHAKERWLLGIAISLSLSLALWLLFDVFLGVGLYGGILGGFLN